jgi:hypothetical protein
MRTSIHRAALAEWHASTMLSGRKPPGRTGFIEAAVFAALTSSSLTIGLAGSAFAISAITGLVSVGIAAGLSFLAQSLIKAPEAPKPEDVQSSFKQPAQPRARHYGRVKVAGPWVFAESKSGNFYKVLALGQGPIDAIEEYWIDDVHVTLDVNGAVQQEPWWHGGDKNVAIFSRLGASTETVYSLLAANFPEWTSAHRGDGVASLLAYQQGPDQDAYFEQFPNGINTNYRVVLRGVKVKNPTTGTTGYNDNAASVVMDYMTHADGMRLPTSIFQTPLALAGWQAAYNRCAEHVTLKGGSFEARYRLWGSYYLNERPADVLGRMLISCDGRLYPTPDGGLKLDIGTWAGPTVVLDEDAIVGFSDVSRGKDILSTANVIRATYLGVDQDYQTTDADPWVDAADVSDRGEIETDTSFIMTPSHSQARRLMKLTAYRANPTWIGTFQCNLRALAALGERFVRITYPQFSIDEVFEVQDFKFNIGEGGILQGVTLQVQSMPSDAYAWDPNQEEGDAPVRDVTTVDRTIPLPTGFDVQIDRKTIGGQPAPYAVLSFNAPPAGLRVEAQGKRTADSQWIPISVQSGATSAESFILSDGEQYEFQIRHSSLTARKSDWTSSFVITPVADETAPGPVVLGTITGGAGQVALNWTAPNSANYFAASIRRNTTNNEGTATLVRTEFGAPSAADSYTDTGLAPGTYWYWIKARNASGVESTSVATGAKTVM